MAVSHVFSNAVADWTGTVTVFDSAGATGTVAATNLVRPTNWNSAHNQFYTLTGNTTGNSTASGTNVLFAGSGGISVGGSTGTIVISGPNDKTYDYFDPFLNAPLAQGTQGQASFHVYPFQLPNVQFDRFGLRVAHRNASNSSGSFTLSNWVGIYTKNGSTLSLLSSTSNSIAITGSGTVGIYSSIGGQRLLTLGFTGTLSKGDYWVAIGSRFSTAGASCTFNQIVRDIFPNSIFTALAANQNVLSYSGIFSEASNATKQFMLGAGIYSASSTAVPGSIAFSEIQGSMLAGTLVTSGVGYIPAWALHNGTI